MQIDAGYDMSPFFQGEMDIWPGFLIDEVIHAREEGYTINLIIPDYYGIHLYGMVLFTTERMIQEKPDMILRFLSATIDGWRWTIENPQKAASLSLIYDPDLTLDHETAQMEASLPLIHTGEKPIGWMEKEVW